MVNGFNWEFLPNEMRLAVLDHLPLKDIWSCAQSSRDSYSTCLPILFHTVNLPSLESLYAFLEAVPAHHCQLIRDLQISTRSSSHDFDHCDAFTRPTNPSPNVNAPLAELLKRCTGLEALDVGVFGGLDARTMLPIFQGSRMERVKKLKIKNFDMEEIAPISERLVIAIAFSLPSLESISLTRITRSSLHAPELLFSSVPLAQDSSSDIPPHSDLGEELRLPQLLRLPKLRQLKIRDTHLGDPMWEEVSSECPLEVLDLGSCAYLSPAANELFATKILARVPPSITACALSTSLPPLSLATSVASPISPATCKSALFSTSPSSPVSPSAPSIPSEAASQVQIPPLPRLRTLHLTPLVPTSSISTTLSQSALAASPVQTLSCSFHPDDAAEGLRELEGFLKEREARERVMKFAQGVKQGQGRKRASSRLSLSSYMPGDVVENVLPPSTRGRANTVGTSFLPLSLTTLPEVPSPSRLYPSLANLTIEIPSSQDSLSPTSPSGSAKLSPRRLAAARRRAEERREAALRLREVARGSGMRVVFRGVELLGEEEESADATMSVTNIKASSEPEVTANVPRARANTA